MGEDIAGLENMGAALDTIAGAIDRFPEGPGFGVHIADGVAELSKQLESIDTAVRHMAAGLWETSDPYSGETSLADAVSNVGSGLHRIADVLERQNETPPEKSWLEKQAVKPVKREHKKKKKKKSKTAAQRTSARR